MQLGAFLAHSADMEHDAVGLEEKFRDLVSIGLYTCQFHGTNGKYYTEENARKIRALADRYGVTITAFWCGAALGEGPCYWDDYNAPFVVGIVPPEYRQKRIENLIKGARFAKAMGVSDVITHVGYMSEYPNSSEFQSIVLALKYVVRAFADIGVNFLFETGQETPIVVLRAIEAIGMDNVGINLDPSNLITNGKGNPVDAMYVFGKYVRGVHAKDGVYPSYCNGGRGREVPIGEGMVDFPRLIEALKEVGYDGALTIEREITGPQQRIDIIKAKEYLEKLI